MLATNIALVPISVTPSYLSLTFLKLLDVHAWLKLRRTISANEFSL